MSKAILVYVTRQCWFTETGVAFFRKPGLLVYVNRGCRFTETGVVGLQKN
ncbi:hypothetical protein [Trichocoleus sp. AS-A2]